jgi:serine protease
MRKSLIHSLAGVALGLAALLAFTVPASAVGGEYAPHPVYMADASHMGASALQPPPICCIPSPESLTGKLPIPDLGNMAYFGGHVQVTPKIYLVFWGWGQQGAFDHATPGYPASDPDGAAARMLAFVKAMGGTDWAGSQTQYFMTTATGTNVNIQNPANQFAGVWYDNTNPIHAKVTGLELAQEADRARAHFGATDLKNSQFVIAQPQNYSEQGFVEGQGYCAWHDYTTPAGYPRVTPGLAFTNMPYVLNAGSSCGQNSVNSSYFTGRLDGFTIVMGHEIEETVTDPGAEEADAAGNALGAWYDLNGWENADKCAWTGVTGATPANTVPGGVNNIKGNDGKLYPVQSLWSNDSAAGAGYCKGAGDDLPITG